MRRQKVIYKIEITYDPEADAMYIKLKEGKFGSNKVINDDTIIDQIKKEKYWV